MARKQKKTNYKNTNNPENINNNKENPAVIVEKVEVINETKKKPAPLPNKALDALILITIIPVVIAIIVAILVGLFYLLYPLYNSVVEPKLIQYNMNHALINGYQYIKYIEYTPSKWALINLLIIFTVYLTGLNLFFMRAAFYGSILRTVIISLAILFVPYIVTGLVSYQSLDKFMAININTLYNLVNTDKSFKNTETSAKFKKAIEENDYATLKIISNDIDSLAKVTPEQLTVVEEIINVMPITEIKEQFNNFKNNFMSYTEYDLFYNKVLDMFKTSEYKDNRELNLLIKKLKITTHDYNQLKIDISK